MILATKQTTKTGNAAAQHNKSANKNKYNTLYPLAAKRPINTANGSSNSRDQRINVDAVACGHKRRISTAIKLDTALSAVSALLITRASPSEIGRAHV